MQQLEFDWWGQLQAAQVDPVGCDFRQLCLCFDAQMERSEVQEQLAVGAEAICLLADCLARRAEAALAQWQQRHDPRGPVLDDEEWGELVRESFWLDLGELMGETPERYRLPAVLEEGEAMAVPMEKAELLEMLKESGVEVLEQVGDRQRPVRDHRVDEDEDVGAWVSQIRAWTERQGRDRADLLEIQQGTGLGLIRVWMALLLGEFEVRQTGEFYMPQTLKVMLGTQAV